MNMYVIDYDVKCKSLIQICMCYHEELILTCIKIYMSFRKLSDIASVQVHMYMRQY